MKILVLGIQKTGTTLLYSMLENSLRGQKFSSFFEPCLRPELYESIRKEKKVLVKDLFMPYPKSPRSEQHCVNFDKKILIIRDPRDQFLSRFMYVLGSILFSQNDQSKIINIMEKKQRSPGSYSFLEFIDDCKNVQPKVPWQRGGVLNQTKRYLEYIRDLQSRDENLCIIKYEDMIENNFENLEKYLDFSIIRNQKVVHPNLNRVIRSKKYNNWKNWYTPSDILILKKENKNLLDGLGYDSDDWTLNTPQILEPEHCQDYLKRRWKHPNK